MRKQYFMHTWDVARYECFEQDHRRVFRIPHEFSRSCLLNIDLEVVNEILSKIEYFSF